MAISATINSKVSIYATPVLDTVDTAAEYKALTPWVEIGEITDLGEFGDEAEQILVRTINRGRVRKLKGTRDAGQMTIACADDPLDPGQIALKAAEKTPFNYAFKVEASDAPSEDYANSVYYFRAKVSSSRLSSGGPDDVRTRNFNVDIDSEITEVPSALITP